MTGIALGFVLRGRQNVLRFVARLSDVALYSLLFLLGLSLGIDEQLMANLPHLGVNGLLLALAALVTSMGCTLILARLWTNRK